MARLLPSRIVPIILIIIIVVIAVAALVSIGQAVFFSGTQTASPVDVSRTALLSTTADRSVVMTVRGPIVADELFHSYQITITPSRRDLVTYSGYLDTVVDNSALNNNVPSYAQFVHALDKANLEQGTAFTGDADNTLGVCATGLVYEFSIKQNDTTIKHLWTSTCSGSKGSLNADVDQLSNLFIVQIPNAQTTIDKIDL